MDESAELLAKARASHQQWLATMSGAGLPPKGAARRRAVNALHAATDVYTWKLLRRDLRLTRGETEGGTVPPELGAARRLVERGHTVVVLAEDSMRADVEATGARFRAWVRATNRASRLPADDPYPSRARGSRRPASGTYSPEFGGRWGGVGQSAGPAQPTKSRVRRSDIAWRVRYWSTTRA